MEETGPVIFNIWNQIKNKSERVRVKYIKRTTVKKYVIRKVKEKERPEKQEILAGPKSNLEENTPKEEIELESRGTKQKAAGSEKHESSADKKSDE